MPCYHPLEAWLTTEGGKPRFYKKTGKKEAAPNWARDLKLPCGRCIGCRLERSKQWALRLMHEAQQHEENCFLTLTYDNNNLPSSQSGNLRFPAPLPLRSGDTRRDEEANYCATLGKRAESLIPRHTQLFMKRLRTERKEKGRLGKVKYYLVGEYGDKLGRPHYHVALFGEGFYDDRYEWSQSPSGEMLYRSSRLEKLWPHGHAKIGNLTFQSAAYIARYIMKKVNGPMADEHYKRVDLTTGEEYWLEPEFAYMSRRPAIGKEWWERWKSDVLTTDSVYYDGIKHKPPRYYDKQVVAASPFKADLIKLVRELRAAGREEDNTPARLKAKETVAQARLALNKRSLE